MARVAVVDFPYHVTQRGNRRQRTFFSDRDYARYLELLAKWPAHFGLEVWAYCLMPNHVHLIVTPRHADGLARGIGEVHRRYTWSVNRARKWRGYLWQGRFSSYILGPTYLLNATRYALRNPVDARLVKRAEDWRWSSARRWIRGEPDDVCVESPLDDLVDDWRAFLKERSDASSRAQIERALRIGRPLADDPLVDRLEILTGRRLRRRQPGPKPKGNGNPKRGPA